MRNVFTQADLQALAAQRGHQPVAILKSANMNSTADQAFTLLAPAGSKLIIRRITAHNASTSLTTAAGGIYTGASKSGTTVVAAAQVYTGLTGSTLALDLTVALAVTSPIASLASLYLSLTTGQGSAATADFAIFGDILP